MFNSWFQSFSGGIACNQISVRKTMCVITWEGLPWDMNVSMPTLLKEKLVPHLQKPKFTAIIFTSGHKKVKHKTPHRLADSKYLRKVAESLGLHRVISLKCCRLGHRLGLQRCPDPSVASVLARKTVVTMFLTFQEEQPGSL